MIGLPYANDAFVIYTKKDCCETEAFIKKLDENEIKYFIVECDEELKNNYNGFSYFLSQFAINMNGGIFNKKTGCCVDRNYLPMFFYEGHYVEEPYNLITYLIAEKFEMDEVIFRESICEFGFTILGDKKCLTYCKKKKRDLEDFNIDSKIINCDELDMNTREVLNCYLKKVVEEENISLPISFCRFGYIRDVDEYIIKLREEREERDKKEMEKKEKDMKGLMTFEINFGK